jgi:hypothetical protein
MPTRGKNSSPPRRTNSRPPLGKFGIEESARYQAIFREGEAVGKAEGLAVGMAEGISRGWAHGMREGVIEAARRLLLILGTQRWGKPTPTMARRLNHVNDIDALEQLAKQLLHAGSWKDLPAALED